MGDNKHKNKKAIIIGCGIAGPSLAVALSRAGIDSAIYESHESVSNFGWLTLTANGTTIWKSFGIFEKIMSESITIDQMIICDSSGKKLGTINTGDELKNKYGAKTILIKRAILNKILCDKVRSCGVNIEFDKKLVNIETKLDNANKQNGIVIASFDDGTSVEGDFLVGCDGIHFRTRNVIMPDSPKPTYSGTVLVGGTAKEEDKGMLSSLTPNTIYLTYGKNAFFGNLRPESEDHMWWTYVHHPESSYKKEEEGDKVTDTPAQNTISWDDWKSKILQIHKEDSEMVLQSIKSPGEMYFHFPIYDITYLPIWHKELVCLIGDAAHATSPHLGEGASMAMEDAIVLAKCLCDIQDTQQAFKTFEKLRKTRTQKVVKMAQRLAMHLPPLIQLKNGSETR